MPKSKSVNAYPFAYRDLIQHVQEKGELKLHFPDKKRAEARRFDLYGYKAALAHEGDSLSNVANQVVMTIEVDLFEGYNLILRNSLDDDINNQIFNAISAANNSGDNIPVPVPPQSNLPSTSVEDAPLLYPEEDTNEQSVYKQYMPGSSQAEEDSGCTTDPNTCKHPFCSFPNCTSEETL